jgi:hypothetical protein
MRCSAARTPSLEAEASTRSLFANPALALPSSEISKQAYELARSISPPFLLHHALRSYAYALMLARRDKLTIDAELVFLGALMHDIGLTEAHAGNEPFGARGGAAAREFLSKHGYDPKRIEIIHEAIAEHLDAAAERRPPEIALVRVGAGVDLFGLHLDTLPRADVERTLRTWPRLDFKHCFGELLKREAQRLPRSPIAMLIEQGLLQGMVGAPFDE